MIHTSVPEDFIFNGLPVFGPAQLSALLRMDVLKRYGGWYFDLDVYVNCNLKKLENTLNLGNKLTVSLFENNSGVCTFASCCPENWHGWDDVVSFMLNNPKSAPGHYCTEVLGNLLIRKPILCDYLPYNFVFSKTWLSHKGLHH